ncbi:MAG: hypothetical protein HY033_13105 [Ignavibacteriae bacterium]|nr:hypothetical protein [Ignavibacteriota bacterium]
MEKNEHLQKHPRGSSPQKSAEETYRLWQDGREPRKKRFWTTSWQLRQNMEGPEVNVQSRVGMDARMSI